MKATQKTEQFLKEAFMVFVNQPVSFEFIGTYGTDFVAVYANGKRRYSYEFCLFSGVPSSWKFSLENYLNTFEK